MKTKVCSKCRIDKSLIYFGKQKGGKLGVRGRCNKCRGEDNKQYYRIPSVKERYRLWRKNNNERLKLYFRIRWKKKGKYLTQQRIKNRNSNIKLRIRHNISSLIQQRLKRRLSNKGGKSIFLFLLYTLEELMINLESKFLPNMSWNNYGKWHIDHVIADCKFDYKSVKNKKFKECWSLDNLQPLWAEDNLRKNKY